MGGVVRAEEDHHPLKEDLEDVLQRELVPLEDEEGDPGLLEVVVECFLAHLKLSQNGF